jgi:hypothetical protein
MEGVIPLGATLKGLDTPWRCGPRAASIEAEVTDTMPYPWLWASPPHLACLARRLSVHVYASSGAHHDVFLLSGRFGHVASSAGRLFIPPSFTLVRGPIFSGERCRGICHNTLSFSWSHGHCHAVRRRIRSVTEFPPVRGFSPVGAVDLSTGPWAGIRFACTGREPRTRLRTVALGPGAEWLVPSDRQSRMRPPRWLCVSLRWAEGLVGDRSLLPCTAGLAPTVPTSRSFAQQFTLAAASGFLLLFSATMFCLDCLKTARDSSARWALRKASSS